MRVLFDTNVLLDHLLARESFREPAGDLVDAVERERIDGLVAAHSVTTVWYLTAKAMGNVKAQRHVRTLLRIFEVASVGEKELAATVEAPMSDYEDAVQVEAARGAAAEAIVTRNIPDFRRASLPVYTPPELLARLRAS